MNKPAKTKQAEWAIGLQYLPDEPPVVVSKGQQAMAEAMRERAEALGIPIQEDDALATALSTLNMNEQIPEALLAAVAELLAWVFWLEGRAPDSTEAQAESDD